MELIGQKRQVVGKTIKGIRKEGLIPAVVYGNEIDSTSIVLNRMAFAKVFAKAGETALIDLSVDALKYKVLVKDIQFDPLSSQIIHASLFKPNLKEKIEAQIPVEIIGEEANALVKGSEAVVLQLMNEITVKALPSDLPEAFVVDVSALTEVGAHVTVGELNFDHSKVEILGHHLEDLVVKLDEAKMAEEAVEEAAGEVDEQALIEGMEATKEKVAEEGADEDKGGDDKKGDKAVNKTSKGGGKSDRPSGDKK